MIAVLQRVSSARVTVDGEIVGAIEQGFLALVCAVRGDEEQDVEYLSRRIATLRVFADDDGKMNLGVDQIAGAVLVVSQFTLAADTRKGRRPSFLRALEPHLAAPMVEDLVARLRARGLPVECGVFGAYMDIELVNDGPVTLVLDSRSGGGEVS